MTFLRIRFGQIVLCGAVSAITAFVSADAPGPSESTAASPVEEIIVQETRRKRGVVTPDTIAAVYYDQRVGNRLYRQSKFKEAFPYLLTAARHGFKPSQAQLSYLYLTGLGDVPQDNEAAIGWLGVAAKGRTMPEISRYYKSLLAQLPETELDDVDDVVERYNTEFGTRANRVTCSRVRSNMTCSFNDEQRMYQNEFGRWADNVSVNGGRPPNWNAHPSQAWYPAWNR